MELIDLLKEMIGKGASDLHIVAGLPPMLRIDGELIQTNFSQLLPDDTRRLLYNILTDTQKARFERDWELDFSLSVQGLARFRVNIHLQRGSVAASLRSIPHKILSIDDLRLPTIVRDLTTRPRGLILVTGPTGSGKSTTMAAMIDEINRTKACHIITVEDPIEYLHQHRTATVEQREVDADTHSFSSALKFAMRQDPDVILIGEMRDLETIAAAVTAAETGHLVLATLHTTDCPSTVDRIIDVFPPHQQQQIRIQLATVLVAVLCQSLLPHASGKGRVVAVEIMLGTPAILALIREGKTQQILPMMEASKKFGMQTFDTALAELYKRRMVTREEVLRRSSKREELLKMIERDEAKQI